MLSTFESALLERHLRRCAACRAFAASAAAQTQLLRGAALEPLPQPVAVPVGRPSRAARGGSVAGVLVAVAAAAVAAVSLLTTGPRQAQPVAARGAQAVALVVFAAKPTPTGGVEVPRVRVEPVSFLDGPVHGYYSIPA